LYIGRSAFSIPNNLKGLGCFCLGLLFHQDTVQKATDQVFTVQKATDQVFTFSGRTIMHMSRGGDRFSLIALAAQFSSIASAPTTIGLGSASE
jgi:hypothetical protein